MSRGCHNQKTKQILKKQELTQEMRLLVHDFSVSEKNRDGNIAIKILRKKLTFIWRN
ncbi:MAG TPA: hypothetical protein VLA01_04730 [Nitrosopumilaceae archaeon]|nr:hypothetical protein [Nitrosopumilaceae archaeon]